MADSAQVRIGDCMVPIDTVHPHPRNPRTGDVEQIAASLERNGQYRAIVVNHDGTILAGNHTWKAAKSLGWTEISATFIHVDDAKADRILLADNRLAELGGYDEDELIHLLRDVERSDDGLAATGWTGDDLALLVASDDMSDVEKEYRPMGSSIGYSLVFDDEDQQRVWFEFLRYLRNRYEGVPTAAQRLALELTKIMAEAE